MTWLTYHLPPHPFSLLILMMGYVGLRGRRRLSRHGDDSATHTSATALLRPSQWMDRERRSLQAYEYLCHIAEAKEWIEACISESIPPITQLDSHLRNGVVLAKLAQHFEPSTVRRIFEAERLQFRHSENINYFFRFSKTVGLPENFHFELIDLYEGKNIPKVIYCIHALR